MPTLSSPFRESEHVEITARSMLPFRYVDKLGVGGHAVVDIVEHKSTGRIFAHKTFRPYYGSDLEGLKQAFQNEINIIKRLHSHPHVIQIFWSYTCGNELGMLLHPVAREGDLRAYLHGIQNTERPPTPEQCSVLSRSFGCLSDGLAFIHNHTIRHKDIKPSNILVHEGCMIFTDFGIALDASGQDTTTTGRPGLFTDHYRAPEVANFEPRNRKSDVFSLGCVFIEIMALLAPDADLGVSDPSPYWERVDTLQNSLMNLSTTNFELGHLYLVLNDMLQLKSVDRMGAEALVRRIRRIHHSQPDKMYKLFCENCEGTDSSTPQGSIKEEEISASGEVLEELNEGHFTGTERRPADAPAFVPYRRGASIQAMIQKQIRKPLSQIEILPEYVCILWRLQNPDFIKIDCTRDVSDRIKSREWACGYRLQEYKPSEREISLHAFRVQLLVMAELKGVQFREKRCEGCHCAHFEWFHTTPEHAAKVIKKYSDWMKNRPYRYNPISRSFELTAWTNDTEELCNPVPFESSD